MIVFTVAGTVLQIGGLAPAADGVRRTRKTYAPDRGIEAQLHTAWERTKRCWSRIEREVWSWIEREVLRRQRTPRAPIDMAVGGKISISRSTSWDVHHGDDLDPAWTVEEKLAALDRRTQGIRDNLNEVRKEQRKDQKQIKAFEKQLAMTDLELREHTDAEVRKLAADGLAREGWGLLLTAVGTVIAALG